MLTNWLTLIIAIITAGIAYLAYRASDTSAEAAKRSARAAERSAKASERSAKVQEEEAARKPEVMLKVFGLENVKWGWGTKKVLHVQLRNEGRTKATNTRGWAKLPADYFKPDNVGSAGVTYPTTDVPLDDHWVAQIDVSADSLPPGTAQDFIIPTQILEDGEAKIQLQATCDEIPAFKDTLTIEVRK